MLTEAVAAALVGLLALWFVLRPLLIPAQPAAPIEEPIDPEETPKGVALLALKEIEFDRETGKLSDADYQMLKEKYTAEALAALRAEERAGAPDDVEALIAHRVRPFAPLRRRRRRAPRTALPVGRGPSRMPSILLDLRAPAAGAGRLCRLRRRALFRQPVLRIVRGPRGRLTARLRC